VVPNSAGQIPSPVATNLARGLALSEPDRPAPAGP
jgi:hypothetical protein